MKIYNQQQELTFNPVLVPEGDVPVVSTDADGRTFLNIKAPGASSVSFSWKEEEHPCTLKDGVWSVEYTNPDAMAYVQLKIDGVRVLTPILPIGYGYSRPYNYVERPVEDAFYEVKNVPHGSVRHELYYAETTGEWQRLAVYTPPGYDENPDKIYPVLYLQHGHGENEIGWSSTGRVNLILDNLLAEGKITPFVVVMACGMVHIDTPEGRIVDFQLFRKTLFGDIIPFAEKKFRIGGCKEMRAMAGLSMGSLQTSVCGFLRPDMFSALGVFSGFVTDVLTGTPLDIPRKEIGRNTHLEILEDKEKFAETFDVFFRAMGEEDPFFPAFDRDDKLLKDKGIDHVRKIYPGSHDWNVWRLCIRDFAQMIFR